MQTTDRKALLDVLNALRPGISTKDIVEHANSIIFKDGLAWSYNDEIAINHPLPEGLNLTGAVLADPLLKLLDRIEGDKIEITIKDEELRIHGGKTKAGIPLKVAETYLVEKIPMPRDKDWITLPDGMLKLLSLASKSAGTDMSRPTLTNLSIGKDQIIGCDNRSLTVCQLKGIPPLPLLPAFVVTHLSQFKPDLVATTAGWIHFVNYKDCILSCRHGTGDYPDTSKLVEVKGSEVEFPKELSDVLERAGIFSETEFDSDQRVSLSLKAGELTVEGKGPMGWLVETLPMKSEVEAEFSVHPECLSTALDFSRKMIIGKQRLLLRGKNFIHVVSV